MCESLKLAGLPGFPFAEESLLHGRFPNARQELRLGAEIFRLQTGGFTGFLNRGEIDVRG